MVTSTFGSREKASKEGIKTKRDAEMTAGASQTLKMGPYLHFQMMVSTGC